MSSRDDLRAFDLPGRAEIVNGRGGLPAVRITTPRASGMMYLHGGQVTSWQPAGAEEVLFVSDRARWESGRAIRGGVPICFPWFGPHPAHAEAPAHGVVRTKPWRLESIVANGDDVTVCMSVASDDDSRRWWPGDFRLVHRATFGTALVMELEAINTGTTPLGIEAALHTYYQVADVRAIRILGLRGTRYRDSVDDDRETSRWTTSRLRRRSIACTWRRATPSTSSIRGSAGAFASPAHRPGRPWSGIPGSRRRARWPISATTSGAGSCASRRATSHPSPSTSRPVRGIRCGRS